MPAGIDPALLVGLAPFDDAAVYQVTPDVAIVSTTDFFPPLVDHPSDFGAIAAANACSDVFAMGGRVVMAVNVAAFPEHFPREAIVAIFDAAAATVAEAGGTIAGGHTIRNPEPIFGLAVQGVVHPDRIFRKEGARRRRRADAVQAARHRRDARRRHAGREGGGDRRHAPPQPRARRRRCRRVAQRVHAVTDVTGYGLFGHAWEMAERAGATFEFDADALPLYAGAADALRRGVRTGGDPRNREHVERHVEIGAGVDADLAAIGFDPQTSGGLLAAVDPAAVGELTAQRVHRHRHASPPDTPRIVLR